MMINTSKIIFCISILLIAYTVKADKAQRTPVFTKYGPVFAVKDRDISLPKDVIYKAVFDVATTSDSPENYSRRIESAARFINMHVLNGVPLENIQLAMVFHGKATKDALTNKAYQKKYQLDNPNSELIELLHNKGVKFYICGQSAAFLGYSKDQLIKPVKLALSAMTQLVVLQRDGYALLP